VTKIAAPPEIAAILERKLVPATSGTQITAAATFPASRIHRQRSLAFQGK